MESELRLYRTSTSGLVEAARLNAVAPPRAAEDAFDGPEVDGNDDVGAGLFLALVQGGHVVDVARLVFCGGEPSEGDGGPDCYSSAPSTSDEEVRPRSRSEEEARPCSRSDEEEVSANLFGAPSLFGGLVGIEEGNRWELEGVGEEDDDVYLTTWEEDEDLNNKRAGQDSSRLWMSGNHDSSDEEGLNELEGVGEEDDDVYLTTWEEDEDLNNKRAGQASSKLWMSGNHDSSDEEGLNELDQDLELNQDLHKELKQDKENEEEKQALQNQELKQVKENEEEKQTLQINLRLWPAQKRAVMKVSCGGKWVLTKEYAVNWLNLEDMLESNLKVDFDAPFATILGFRNTSCTMDFEITMDSSAMLSDLMTVIKPSIHQFQILKRVGGKGACRVFKCLFMGRKCALKALTQEDPCTLEPRETEIISNLKDPHVMVFYQAWREPWAFKGRPKQEYIFMHLEFCQSTLKHALLYKNLHWFPNKWDLFEEILRSVSRLHKEHVVHRDLKPDNIFFNSEMRVLIGDFGDACFGRDELGLYGGGTPKLGTKGYLAPELNSGGKVTEKTDMYSLGVILFEVFAKFQTDLERKLVFLNLSVEGPPDSWDGDRKLYEMMTALEPNDRPSAVEVLDYIRQYHSEG